MSKLHLHQYGRRELGEPGERLLRSLVHYVTFVRLEARAQVVERSVELVEARGAEVPPELLPTVLEALPWAILEKDCQRAIERQAERACVGCRHWVPFQDQVEDQWCQVRGIDDRPGYEPCALRHPWNPS